MIVLTDDTRTGTEALVVRSPGKRTIILLPAEMADRPETWRRIGQHFGHAAVA
jgi:hypothetical protein